jgi:hypothetical protein
MQTQPDDAPIFGESKSELQVYNTHTLRLNDSYAPTTSSESKSGREVQVPNKRRRIIHTRRRRRRRPEILSQNGKYPMQLYITEIVHAYVCQRRPANQS